MKTMERDSTPPPIEVVESRSRNRMFMWLAAAMAVALIAFGTWAFVDSGDGLTAEQEQMVETLDAYIEAWNDHDGEAAAALMATDSSYHDNGTARIRVADGRFADYVTRLRGFSVRSEGKPAFVGDFVMTTDYIPESSTSPRPSIFRMTSDGTKIIWHYAP